MRKFDAKAKCLSRPVILEAKRRGSIRFFLTFLLSIALAACGGDSGTSANDDNVSSSSSSSVIPASSGNRPSSSSKKIASSSSTPRNDVKSSSSKRSEGDPSSSSQKITSSSSVKTVSSSSVALSSSSKQSSSSKKVESSSSLKNSSSSAKVASSSSVAPASSSSKKVESSSSEYVPYDHFKCLADNWNLRDTIYKQFTDTRNGRSYYYYTAVSSKTGKSVTVMAENLNVGDMVLGEKDQNDDSNIERYCYNNDTTYCDQFGGLYQWAEMMQLPSRCNTESCSDLIQENHRGICPEGWRLFTWDDYVIIRQYEDKYDEGISGLRSQCFNGTNTSGFSLVSAGKRVRNGKFERLIESVYFFTPEEHDENINIYAHMITVAGDVNAPPVKNDGDRKLFGFSVRCVKLE